MYTLKSIARRGTTLGTAVALLVATIIPSASVFADSLNPLTNRSLTLSSSSPGWAYTDGSGNAKYAPPNSGANGQKTGNTFEFTTSSDSTGNAIKAMTFQYCTTSAGLCTAPGNNSGAAPARGADTTSTSDLNVNFPSPDELDAADFSTVVGGTDGIVDAVPGITNPDNPADVAGQYAAKDVAGNFVVYKKTGPTTWVQSEDWFLKASNVENGSGALTGTNNYITLVNDTGETTGIGTTYKVVFFGTTNNYITNPGAGAFFVKINTYNDFTKADGVDTTPWTADDIYTVSANDIIDGGVTVANVMNQSIQITTKVLETMQFSVGTVDPNTLDSTNGTTSTPSALELAKGVAPDNVTANRTKHGSCDTMLKALDNSSTDKNVLQLGRQDAESSLETDHTFSTRSYWRLSSNSSAGATVYYSGHTLSNTVGDQINPIGPTASTSLKGSEQFGLAIAAGTTSTPAANPFLTDYSQDAGVFENGADNGLTGVHASVGTDHTAGNIVGYHTPRLAPLVPQANYDGGSGTTETTSANDASFAFDPMSDTVPVALAMQNTEVVDCVTAKMRYIANIAATTPAGIYTTKINYIAAPQY